MAERTVQVAFRLPQAMVDDLDREVERLRVQHPAFRIARADVVRDILHQYFAGVVHESPALVQGGAAPLGAVRTEAARVDALEDTSDITCQTEVDTTPQPVVLGSKDDRAPERSPDPKPCIEGTDIPYAAFDPSKHYLDKPCHKAEHTSHGEAGNMYYISGKQCWACKTLRNRARITAKGA